MLAHPTTKNQSTLSQPNSARSSSPRLLTLQADTDECFFRQQTTIHRQQWRLFQPIDFFVMDHLSLLAGTPDKANHRPIGHLGNAANSSPATSGSVRLQS